MRILIIVLLAGASLSFAAEPPAKTQGPPAPEAEPASSVTADSAASSTARPKEAPSAETADERSTREKAEDEALVREGYKIKVVDGEKRYCKKDSVLGSRLNTRTICWSAEQIRANKEDADILRDKQNQRRTMGGT
jgi:hypothetical protein